MAATISRKRLARFVASELQRGVQQREIMRKVAAYLAEHKQVHDADFVIGDIAAELAARGVTGRATVTTARPLQDAERKAVQVFVAKRLHVPSVELLEVVNPTVIGGIIIETSDARYDRSLRHGIDQLISA